MNHLKTALFLTSIPFLLASCAKERIRGTGNIISQERALASFENVHIQGPVKVNVRHGSNQQVTVRTDAVAISKVWTTVSNNTLLIDVDEHPNYQHITFEVDVYMPVIHQLTHEGVSNSMLSGFENVDALVLQHNGVGDLSFQGSATNLHITHDGVGDLHAFNFVSDTCHVGHSGVGHIEVTVQDRLEGYLSGVGSIHYMGSPEVSVTDTGVGNVVHVN